MHIEGLRGYSRGIREVEGVYMCTGCWMRRTRWRASDDVDTVKFRPVRIDSSAGWRVVWYFDF